MALPRLFELYTGQGSVTDIGNKKERHFFQILKLI